MSKGNSQKIIEYSIKDKNLLISYLSRFTSMSELILLEINENSDTILTKAVNENKTIIKTFKEFFSNVFIAKNKTEEPIVFGIYNINKIIKILRILNDSSIGIKLKYKTKNEKVGAIEIDSFELYDKFTKFELTSPVFDLFIYLSDEQEEKLFNTEDKILEFNFNNSLIANISNLTNIDLSDILTIKNINKKLYFVGNNFEIEFEDDGNLNYFDDSDFSKIIKKDKLLILNNENYSAVLTERYLILNSLDSELKIIISFFEEE